MVPSFCLLLACYCIIGASLNTVEPYIRPPPRHKPPSRFLLDHDDGSSLPQQIHISLAGPSHMRISWITKGPAPAVVQYGTVSGSYPNFAAGSTHSYTYILYKSGHIHDVVIGPLEPDTTYYYRCSSDSTRELTMKTPPLRFPILFAVVGDLGQTGWTDSTLHHVASANHDALLLPGDLSYADFLQPLWDEFGSMVEPLASQRPWMVTQGNHEREKIPILHDRSFTAYNSRWKMPYQEANSNSNLFYSFNVAGVHVVMLGSYTDFEPGSDQSVWLQQDLYGVNRGETPWLIVVVHAPWYSSNTAHQGEAESVEMRRSMEKLLYDARVDVVFSGHVHAYERFTRVMDGEADRCAPVHITIGDGGNREGLAGDWIEPKREISVFRESSFGHGRLMVANASHALWSWFRNDDDVAATSDSVWLTSLSSTAGCDLHDGWK